MSEEMYNMELADSNQLEPDTEHHVDHIEPFENPEFLESELQGMIQAAISKVEISSGPLPPPEVLKQYETIMPGATNRIFEMAEEEASHRRKVKEDCVRIESRDSLLGIIFAACLCIGTIVAGVVIALNVPSTAGTVMGCLLGGSGLASVFALMLRTTRTSWEIGSVDNEEAIHGAIQIPNTATQEEEEE